MTWTRTQIDIEAGDTVQVDPPRTVARDTGSFVMPWHIRYGVEVALAFVDRAKLLELRDVITAALDAHGDQS